MLKRIPIFLLVFSVVTVWLFSGWPPILQSPVFPPQVQIASAATTSNLFPIADGTDDSSFTAGTVNCTTSDCYTELDSESTGSDCAAGGDGDTSDGDTSYISGDGQTGDRQSFDLDESSIPDNATVTDITVFGCVRRNGAGTHVFRFYTVHSGNTTDAGSTIDLGSGGPGSYGEENQSITVNYTKTAGSDIEIGINMNGNSDDTRFTEMWAVITYTAPSTSKTAILYPTADGGDDSNWTLGTVSCAGANCSTEVDSETGSECVVDNNSNGSDGDTTHIKENTGNLRQSFDLDESSIPDNSTITAIHIYGCNRKAGAFPTPLTYYVNLDGANTDGVTPNLLTTSYLPYGETITLSYTKTSGSDIEIGGFLLIANEAFITEMWAVIDFTAPSNTLPVASAVSIDSDAVAVNLIESTTTTVSCVSTVTDADGFADITSVKAELHRSGVAAGSTDDNNDHYTLSGDANCVPSGGSGTTETYTCDFDVQYYADPTDAGTFIAEDWECLITPTDGVGDGSTASDTIEINSLAALDATAAIAHGTLDLGADTGATNQTTTITNTGNINIDVEFSGTELNCFSGVVPLANLKYDTLDVTYASLANTLTGVAVEQDLDIAQQTNDLVTSTTDLFWGVAMPASGVGGNCIGLITATVVGDIAVD